MCKRCATQPRDARSLSQRLGLRSGIAHSTLRRLLSGASVCMAIAIVSSQPVIAAQVVAGNSHSLQLRSDGSLWAWGANSNGQLGDGTRVSKSATVQVLTGVESAAAGFAHSIAVKYDGTLWAWGLNAYGQLGDGTASDKSNPTKTTLTAVKAVAAGGSRSHAIRADGTLWSWGLNDAGQLGDGSKTNRTTPVQVLSDVQQVAAGGSHTLALKADATLWAWGSNGSGQLGDGTTTEKTSPVLVMSGVRAIAAGVAFSVAVRSDGSLWTWGNNALGQLGTGTTASRSSPQQVLAGVSLVAAGSYHVLALRNGTLWVWGSNQYGQLGDGSTINRLSPVELQSGITALAGGNSHSMAIKVDGTLLTWGNNADGQLGDGSTVSKATPFRVFDGGQAVAAGVYHSISLKSDGTVWSWGDNFFGQIGASGPVGRAEPSQVLGNARAIAAGQYHSIALLSDGTVWTWGFNLYGQLGDGTTADRNTPTQVMSGVSAIAAGASHTLAIKSDGSLWGWGNNLSGQLGDGTTISRSSPTQLLTGVSAAAGGAQHTIAIRADGSLWAWGSNSFGQLGDGTTSNRLLPTRILEGAVGVAAGAYHSLALKSDATLWGWGLNAHGQVGDGSTDNRVNPRQVLDRVQSIVAGHDYNIAKRSNGTLSLWGANRSGILGPNFSGPYNPVPTENAYLRNATAMSGGAQHALAVDAGGDVIAWGDNGSQQLAITRVQQATTPSPPADPVVGFGGTVLVVEYFNATLTNGAGAAGIGHYFLTASATEAAGIDGGLAGPGWRRTGRTFRAWSERGGAPANAVAVCRFYAQAPNSHFYTADSVECLSLQRLNPNNSVAAGWAYENIAFYTVPATLGACPAGHDPVYRSYNNRYSPDPARNDGNHRITPSFNDHFRAINFFGYVDEGVAFCSPINPTNAGTDLQATLTHPGATVESGNPLAATFTFGNNGAGEGGGATIFVGLPPEVTNWAVECTARGGTRCPADLRPVALRSGVRVGEWPAGGTLTLRASGIATDMDSGTEPVLTFAASVAAASGSPDPNPANDSPPIGRTVVKRAAACNTVVNPGALSVGPSDQAVEVVMITGTGCAWTALSTAEWLHVSPTSGVGEAILKITPGRNVSSSPRTSGLTVGAGKLVVTQAGSVPSTSCESLRLQREGDQVAAGGLTGTNAFTVYAESECAWVAQSNVPWIAVVAGGSGRGNGGVNYSVAGNDTAEIRAGAIAIGGKAFTINQASAASGISGAGGDSGGDGGDGGGNGGSSGGDSG
jgi:alpha-tubulin suppressor-like RCC1 family protein